MTDINSVIVIGRLTRDCEFKSIGNTYKTNFTVAVNRQWNKEEDTSFFDVELWGALGNAIKDYLTKGTKLAIRGSLVQGRWTTQDGEKRSKVFILANDVELLDNKSSNNNNPVADEFSSLDGINF